MRVFFYQKRFLMLSFNIFKLPLLQLKDLWGALWRQSHFLSWQPGWLERLTVAYGAAATAATVQPCTMPQPQGLRLSTNTTQDLCVLLPQLHLPTCTLECRVHWPISPKSVKAVRNGWSGL